MSWNLSTTNIVAYCRTDKTFPVGFPVTGFADGDAISASSTQIAEMVIGVDNESAVYVFPSPKELTITLLPSTPSAKNFMLLASAMEKGIDTDVTFDEVTFSVTLPSQGISVTYSGGILTQYPTLPNVKQRLENVQFTFKFAKVKVTEI